MSHTFRIGDRVVPIAVVAKSRMDYSDLHTPGTIARVTGYRPDYYSSEHGAVLSLDVLFTPGGRKHSYWVYASDMKRVSAFADWAKAHP